MQLFPEIERDPLGVLVLDDQPILPNTASWRLRMSASVSSAPKFIAMPKPDDAVELVERLRREERAEVIIVRPAMSARGSVILTCLSKYAVVGRSAR